MATILDRKLGSSLHSDDVCFRREQTQALFLIPCNFVFERKPKSAILLHCCCFLARFLCSFINFKTELLCFCQASVNKRSSYICLIIMISSIHATFLWQENLCNVHVAFNISCCWMWLHSLLKHQSFQTTAVHCKYIFVEVDNLLEVQDSEKLLNCNLRYQHW